MATLTIPKPIRRRVTPDGMVFRTGIWASSIAMGSMFISRRKEFLVLGGGKKCIPEDLERIYGRLPRFEIAYTEDKGAVVLGSAVSSHAAAAGATNLSMAFVSSCGRGPHLPLTRMVWVCAD